MAFNLFAWSKQRKMQIRRLFFLGIVTLGLATLATKADAAGTVQLELLGDAKGSAMVFQEWMQLLGKAGIQNVRIRVASDSDNPGIETKGTADSPVYIVTGVVASRDELLLPGGRFRRSDVGRLTQWLNDLAQHGPNAGKEKKAVLGLTAAQLERAMAELSPPVGFATKGMSCRQVVEKIGDRLKSPLKLDGEAAEALADQTVDDELTDLSRGTALAHVLRLAGYGLTPTATDDGLTYAVTKVQSGREVWPVGWPSEKRPQESVPALFEFLNVNVRNVSAATALDTIAKRLKTPVLVDRSLLTRYKIDPAKAMVSLPGKRTTYSIALRTLLSQAKMKFEVRHDEAGTPLLWVTSVKPG
jgi:hypothetical protein